MPEITEITELPRNFTPLKADEAARKLLERGFAPVPLHPCSKQPAQFGWTELNVAERDISTLFPSDSNIGLRLGEPSNGLVDIDLDSDEARHAATLLLPDTEMISGRPSALWSHWWFRVDSPPGKASEAYDDPVASSAGRKPRLLELRSTGGQTMVPPSTHPSGEPCEWYAHGEPAQIDIAELRKAVSNVAAAALLGRYWPDGARHEASLALAGALLRASCSVDFVKILISAICAAAGDNEVADRVEAVRTTARQLGAGGQVTGWPRLIELLGANGAAIVDRVGVWLGIQPKFGRAGGRAETPKKGVAPAQRRCPPLPPHRPFPTDTLSEIPRKYVEATAAAMNCPVEYSALPTLALLGAAIGSSHVASPKHGWKEPPYIWAVSIGLSGSTKSPPYRDVEDIAEDVNDCLESAYQQEMADHENSLREWTEKHDAGEDAGPRPKPPGRRALIKGDVTIEALVGTLQANPRGILVAQDELNGWIGGFARYSGRTGATGLPHWLQLHNAGTISVTRKTGEPREIRVRGVGVSVTGTIQPNILAGVMSEDFRASGLLARLLVAMPPWKQRRWTEHVVPVEIRQAFAGLVGELHTLPGGTWPNGQPAPHLVHLSKDARNLFIGFYNANGVALETVDADTSAAIAKLEGYALRFALIRHCCRYRHNAKNHKISAEDMAAEILLTEWFRDEAERVYLALGDSSEQRASRQLSESVGRLANRLVAKRNGFRGVTARDLQHSNGRRYRTHEAAEAALESLVEAGFGDWYEVPPPTHQGGQTVRYFVPCPTSDTSDTRSQVGTRQTLVETPTSVTHALQTLPTVRHFRHSVAGVCRVPAHPPPRS